MVVTEIVVKDLLWVKYQEVLADYTIITSDNPRSEKPEEIVEQIEKGITKTKGSYECIVDRKEAIKKGIEMLHTKRYISYCR